jgi:hypothetical protein
MPDFGGAGKRATSPAKALILSLPIEREKPEISSLRE